MLGNISEAEDLTQEAFLQLFRKIHLFRGESAFSTWLHRMAVNLVLMRLRRKAPRQVPLEGEAELSSSNDASFREIGGGGLSTNTPLPPARLPLPPTPAPPPPPPPLS